MEEFSRELPNLSGAAVRGEAVADGGWNVLYDKDTESDHYAKHGDALAAARRLAQGGRFDVRVVAADAPSEPIDAVHNARLILIRELGDEELIASVKCGKVSIHAALLKVLRAADALDSQPTDQEARDRIRNAIITCGHAIEDKSVKLFRDPKFPGGALSQLIDRIILATSGFSQPTDGGVRNG